MLFGIPARAGIHCLLSTYAAFLFWFRSLRRRASYFRYGESSHSQAPARRSRQRRVAGTALRFPRQWGGRDTTRHIPVARPSGRCGAQIGDPADLVARPRVRRCAPCSRWRCDARRRARARPSFRCRPTMACFGRAGGNPPSGLVGFAALLAVATRQIKFAEPPLDRGMAAAKSSPYRPTPRIDHSIAIGAWVRRQNVCDRDVATVLRD